MKSGMRAKAKQQVSFFAIAKFKINFPCLLTYICHFVPPQNVSSCRRESSILKEGMNWVLYLSRLLSCRISVSNEFTESSNCFKRLILRS